MYKSLLYPSKKLWKVLVRNKKLAEVNQTFQKKNKWDLILSKRSCND